MGRRGRPPKRPASATSSAEQHMKRIRDICLNSRFVNIGENGKKWQQHRRACEGSQPGFDFVAHLLSLHDVHCSRAPPENIDVKLEVDDEALQCDNGSLDEVRVSLDGDLARQWRHLQKVAGYEAAEMEYLCWLMTVAEQMLGWKSQPDRDNNDRAEEDADYTPEPPRQRRRRMEPAQTSATAGPSFDSPAVYDTPTDLPEYGLQTADDSNSGSGEAPLGGSGHVDSDGDDDVKPDIVPAEGTLTKFTIKWADKPSTSTAPTSIETETTRLLLQKQRGNENELTGKTHSPTCEISGFENFELKSISGIQIRVPQYQKLPLVGSSLDKPASGTTYCHIQTLTPKKAQSNATTKNSDHHQSNVDLPNLCSSIVDLVSKHEVPHKPIILGSLTVTVLSNSGKKQKWDTEMVANSPAGDQRRGTLRRVISIPKRYTTSLCKHCNKPIPNYLGPRSYRGENENKCACKPLTFTMKSNLKVRKNVVPPMAKSHPKHASRRFVSSFCKLCSSFFVNMYRLNLHKHHVHGAKEPCHLCGKVFKTDAELNFHRRMAHPKPLY